MEEVFERAVVSSDLAYLQLEEQLLAGGANAEITLRRHRRDADPVSQLLAEALLEATADGGRSVEKATAFMNLASEAAARSVRGKPSPIGLADTLTRAFGPRLAEFLAVRLVKESRPPDWRALATLAYLDRHKDPKTTDAVIRFATQNPVPELQRAAAQVLANSGDPALAQKLAAERERLAHADAQLPPVLAALSSPLGGIV